MVRTTLALCAVVLSGCAAHTLADGGGRAGDGGPPECAVKVFVRPSPGAGKVRILVDNDPVYPKGSCGAGVTWRLMTPGYTFGSPAIAFGKHGTTPPVATCAAAAADQYSCTFGDQPLGNFPYSINVLGPGGRQTLDPSVIVD